MSAKRKTVFFDQVERIIFDFHWMARRYADGRSSYAPHLFNARTRSALALGFVLNPTADETIWARDGMGRAFDGLTEAEAAEGRGVEAWQLHIAEEVAVEREKLKAVANWIAARRASHWRGEDEDLAELEQAIGLKGFRG